MDADEYIAFQREASRAAGTWHSPEADDSKGVFRDRDWPTWARSTLTGWESISTRNACGTSHSLTIVGGQRTKAPVQNRIQLQERTTAATKTTGHDHFYLTADLSHQGAAVPQGRYSRAAHTTSSSNDKPDMFNTVPAHVPAHADPQRGRQLQRLSLRRPVREEPLHERKRTDVYKDKTEEWKTLPALLRPDRPRRRGSRSIPTSHTAPAFSSRGYYYDNRSRDRIPTSATWPSCTTTARPTGSGTTCSTTRRPVRQAHYRRDGRLSKCRTARRSTPRCRAKDQESPAYLWYNMGPPDRFENDLSSGFVRSQMVSVVGRVQYSYDDRYIVTASFREDGASQLSPGQ